MKKIFGSLAVLFFFCGIGQGQEVRDLLPDHPGVLTCWRETRTAPRPIRICYLKIALNTDVVEVIAIPGNDPDGAGPAESELTQPIRLMKKFNVIAAINANAFEKVSTTNPVPKTYWYEGQLVDMVGAVACRGKLISPTEPGRTPFWLDDHNKPHIGDPESGDIVREAVSDWISPLLLDSRIIPDSAGSELHPRTALGFDDSGDWLLLAVVDGRQPGFSEGVTLHELASIMKSQGCSQSINLDGGGSSVMMVPDPDGRIRPFNSPSDKEPRSIPVMLGVRRTIKQN